MPAKKNTTATEQFGSLDAKKAKTVRRALRDAAQSLSATKLLAQHPWDVALDIPF